MPEKLQPIPKSHRISKRPPPRPAIPSPYASAASPKVVYITAKTPFHSATKRVRKLLALADKRAAGRVDLLDASKDDAQKMRELAKTVDVQPKSKGQSKSKSKSAKGREDGPEEILLRGTGKAITRVLEVGLWFQGQEDYRIRVRTGTICAVDDIVEREDLRPAEEQDVGDEVDAEVPESRIRRLSMVEIGVSSTYTPSLDET